MTDYEKHMLAHHAANDNVPENRFRHEVILVVEKAKYSDAFKWCSNQASGAADIYLLATQYDGNKRIIAFFDLHEDEALFRIMFG